ncbi:MAG: hypothetical protein WCW16_01020 [Candidatus Magasanikbacteria bacterium]
MRKRIMTYVVVLILVTVGCSFEIKTPEVNFEQDTIDLKTNLVKIENSKNSVDNEFLGTDRSVKYIEYYNNDFGIKFKVPGGDMAGVQPYLEIKIDKLGRFIEFGPIVSLGYNRLSREFYALVTELKNGEQRKDELKKEYNLEIDVDVKKINNNQVLIYKEPGMCDPITYEVVGVENNYRFISVCEWEHTQQILNNVIQSFEFSK